MVPQYKQKFPLEDFKSWMEANPNMLWLEPKGPFELCRFLSNGGQQIIYFNRNGELTYTRLSQSIVEEFQLCQSK